MPQQNPWVDMEGMKRNLDAWKSLFGYPSDPLQDIPEKDRTPPTGQPNPFFDASAYPEPDWPGKYELDQTTIDQLKPFFQQLNDASFADDLNQSRGIPNSTMPAPPKFQKQNYDELKKLIDQFENRKGEFDLTPLLALTDAWTGSNLSSSYDRPLTKEERQQKALTLKASLAEKQAQDQYKQDYLDYLLQQQELQRQKANDYNATKMAIEKMRQDGRTKDPTKTARSKMILNEKTYKQFQPQLISLSSMIMPVDPNIPSDQKLDMEESNAAFVNAKINDYAMMSGKDYSYVLKMALDNPQAFAEQLKSDM